ncbi:MAG: hypothetical protein A2Y77_16185 [Planctomycetes bacterium RBG_13_62_9]|nr:MAG: hypothetical protein A2Y77_16185 [Planctomycetes bacterium RBG_13_62_9]
MRKLIKAILFIVIVLIVLVIAGVVGVFLFADRVVASAVESAGTKALNVSVDVGSADASILGGAVGLQNITVANPPGYDGPALLKLQRVDVAADTGSLLSNEVRIKTMTLADMEVFVEQKGLKNNLYEVIQPLRQPREPTGKKLIIDTLEITNIKVHASLAGVPGRPQAADFTLSKITTTELGRDKKMDTAVLIGKILLAVAAGVAEQGGDILPKETVNEITGILDKAMDIGRIILGPGRTDPDQKGTQDVGKSITEGLQDLLGGKKKE